MLSKNVRERELKPSREPRKYILVCEGERTENQYFRGVSEVLESKGMVSGRLEIAVRDYSELSVSNPCRNLKRLLVEMRESLSGVKCVESLVNLAVNQLVDENVISKRSGVYAANKITPRLLKDLESLGFSGDSIISDDDGFRSYAEFEEVLTTVFEKELEARWKEYMAESINASLRKRTLTFTPGYDRVCMVFDRDASGSFTNERYDKFISVCRANKVSAYISNPCFEFWILLHFCDCSEFELHRFKEDMTYLNECLHQYHPKYSKRVIHFEMLRDLLPQAIENAKKYCTNLDELKTQFGSNIGCLLEDLIRENIR